MVDIHSHVLPYIDDGARNEDEAIMMLQDAYNKGISVVYATPHLRVYSDEELKSALEKREEVFTALLNETEKRGALIPQVKKGFEVHLDNDVTEFSDFSKLCFEGTNKMLVEMPMHHWDGFTINRIEALKNEGIVPVLAHIERYIEFKKNIEKALSLEGVIYQVSADAFFGFRRLRFIKKLFEMGKIVIVGSDMHNMDTRKNKMAEAYKKAIRKNKGFEIMFETDISALL